MKHASSFAKKLHATKQITPQKFFIIQQVYLYSGTWNLLQSRFRRRILQTYHFKKPNMQQIFFKLLDISDLSSGTVEDNYILKKAQFGWHDIGLPQHDANGITTNYKLLDHNRASERDRRIEIDTLEYQQTEKIETELKDVDRIRANRCKQICQGSPSGASHSHNTINYSFPADSPPSRKEAPRWRVLYRISRQLLHRARCGIFSQKIVTAS